MQAGWGRARFPSGPARAMIGLEGGLCRCREGVMDILDLVMKWCAENGRMGGVAWLSRREFMRRQGLLAASLAFSGLAPKVSWAASDRPYLSVVTGAPGPAARMAIELLGGMGSFVKRGQKVVIKPNMSFSGGVRDGVTTHPEVVREIVAMCSECRAGRILVLDHTLRPPERCIGEIRNACRPFGGDIVHGLDSRDFYRQAAIPQGVDLKGAEVMKDVLDADVLIAVPVAKSHSSTGVSLSMKGMMGLVWNRTVMHWRHDLDESIVDLCTLLKPSLVVIDATRVLSTNGPSGPGEVIFADTVIASRDMVAADAYTVAAFPWYGRRLPPEKVRHVRIASARGLGRMDVGNLEVKKVTLR